MGNNIFHNFIAQTSIRDLSNTVTILKYLKLFEL